MKMRIGLVGCGNISDIYLTNAQLFEDIEFVAVSSRNVESAKRTGERYELEVRSIDRLVTSDDVDIVLNLTTPRVHAAISLAAIEAGKHVYTEKPLATSLAEGKGIAAAAAVKGLRVGCAPDTVLGSGIQTARAAIDREAIGKPLIGMASVLSHGMEAWHPNPASFYQHGGGPVFDLGPYYITALVTLLGPIVSVSAVGQKGSPRRTITAEHSPFRGEAVAVDVLTSVQALLDFASGVQVTFTASWDVWRHSLPPIELHGTDGSMRLGDPDTFGGVIATATGQSDWLETDTASNTFGRKNWPTENPQFANYRGLGLAEMARAIIEGRPHRASVEVSLHTLAVMSAIVESADQRNSIDVAEVCRRPEAFAEDEAKSLLSTLGEKSLCAV
jgi:predicted dehydrogenase